MVIHGHTVYTEHIAYKPISVSNVFIILFIFLVLLLFIVKLNCPLAAVTQKFPSLSD